MWLPFYSWKNTLRDLRLRLKTPPAYGHHPHHGQPRGRTTAIEPLQDRNLLSGTTSQVDAAPLAQQLADALAAVSSPVVYHLADGGSRVNFDGLSRVQLTADGSAPSGLSQLPMPQAVEFVGADNVDNTLALDMGALANSPINTVVYQGGANGYDTLKLGGGTFKTITYTVTGKDSGIITYSSLEENQPDKTVIFTGLEPVVDLDEGNLVVTGSESSDDIHVVSGDDMYDAADNLVHTLRLYETNSNFEEITFGNKWLLTINGSGGDDNIDFEAAVIPPEISSISIYGGDGNDTFAFTSPNTFGSGDLYFSGDDGDDDFNAPAGGSTLDGGDGNDHYNFAGSTDFQRTRILDSGTDLNILDFSQLDYGSGITLDLNSGGDEDLIATDGVDKSLELDLSYQPQINFVVGTAYDDTIIGNSLGDILEGGDGNDLLASGAGNDDLEGGAGDDTYVFDAAHAIDDSLGSDVITENIDAGNDTLDFSSFSDAYGGVTINLADTDEQTVHDSSLDLTLADGNSIENVIGNDAGLYATGNDLDNSLIGGAEDDVLAGGAGNDVLEGRGGDDSLTGGDGNDTYVFNPTGGNLGTDTITEDANAGSDTLDFSALTDDVTVDISSTTNPQTIHSSELSLYLTDATGIENVIGSSTAANTITGNSRDNYLLGGAVVDTIDGGSGNDTLEGAAGNDSLTGGTGDDTYVFDPLLGDDGDLGSDTIYEAANAGSDTLDFSNFAEDQPVTIDLGNTSAQTVSSGVLTLTLATYNTGIENVLSGAGDDSITGNSRANILDGGDGDDILIGNDGDDRLYGESGEDQLQGNAGSDALYGGDDADILYGGTGDDFLYGQDGNDTLTDYDHFGSTTEGGADYFDGGNGNDSLYTYSGNDTLIGGAGDDVLVGGTGADTFSFVWHQGDYGLGSDTITQDTSDTLDFSHFYSVDYAAPDSTASGDQPVSDDQVSDALDSESEPDVRDLLTVNFSNTDAVGGVISPDAFTSSVAGVTVASDDSGTLEISAYGLQGTYDSVDFYLDSNRNGVLDTNDQFLGTANDLTESASFDLPYDLDLGVFTAQDGHSTTVNSAPGPAALFAVPMEGGAPGSPSSPTALAQGLIPKAPPPTATRALLLKRGIFGGAFASVNAQAYGGQPLYEYDTPAPQFDHEEDGTAEMSDPNGYISWSNGIVNSTASSKMDIRGSFTVNATNSAKTSGAAALWGTGDAWATPTAKANTNSPPGPDKWIIDPVYPIGNPDGYYRGSVFVAKIVGTITVSWANFATAVGTSASAGSATIAGVDISARSPIIGEQPWGTGQDYSLNLITKTTTTSTGPIGTLVYTHGSTTLINTTKLNPNFGSLTKTFTLTVGTSHAFPAVVSLTSSLIQSSTANTGGAFYSAVYAFGQSTVQVTFRVVSMTYDSSLLISDGD